MIACTTVSACQVFHCLKPTEQNTHPGRQCPSRAFFCLSASKHDVSRSTPCSSYDILPRPAPINSSLSKAVRLTKALKIVCPSPARSCPFFPPNSPHLLKSTALDSYTSPSLRRRETKNCDTRTHFAQNHPTWDSNPQPLDYQLVTPGRGFQASIAKEQEIFVEV